ncbi:hypothetical protein GTA08_BOTSDO13739 [Botryosphaeria dothidea]|uniref:Zn(2)-C6 fungal-type domain-containing protein n=1 Tax=Botryosphaeria dothidea TaxID=55169 RepID=A0A8H4J0I7_9PEZI|nr:hypothetical protein GTA08_BOTSDO13739 [Botryosphaeria dothidea]
MFMIMPKSASQPQGQQRLAGRPARVKAACDRCRHKKIKCDGLTPCSRCKQEQLVCTAARKPPPADPLSASREYIQSLETQQSSLVRVLRRMHRLLRQHPASNDLEDVADALKSCGFELDDADHVPTSPRKRSNSHLSSRAPDAVKRMKYDHGSQSDIAADSALQQQDSAGLPQLVDDPFFGVHMEPISLTSFLNFLNSPSSHEDGFSDFPKL